MNWADTQHVAAAPDDTVRMTLDDLEMREALLNHALATLGRRQASRPAIDRMERAKELCQETYVRALEKRHDYDPARPVGPWLHGIMNNVLSEAIRALYRSPAQDSADPAAWERLNADLDSDAAEVVPGRVDACSYLAMLPSEHREVLRLRFFEGLDHSDIAARLGISLGNARVRLCRALIAAKMIAGVDPREGQP
jgi:RNA polymerase sigma-70 factor (ECF subfamily)